MVRMIYKLSLTLALTALLAPQSLAAPFSFSYGGRLANGNTAVTGPVDIQIKFFRTASGGTAIPVSAVLKTGVTLDDGVFQVDVTELSADEMQMVFDPSSGDTYVEVTDKTNNVTYPRQRMTAIPYALKVPVDGTTVKYDTHGQLTAVTAAVTSVGGVTADNVAAGANAANAATNANTASTIVKRDGSGNIAVGGITASNMALSNALGLGVLTSTQETNLLSTLTTADKGKTWFNGTINQMRYFDGTAAQTIGAAGAGISSLSGMSGNSQALAVNTTGSSLAWAHATISSVDTHTLSIPMASTASVSAGLLSNTDYTTFNAKQGAISGTTVLTGGTFKSSLQDGIELGPYSGSVTGELRFDAASGSNYVGFKAPNSIGANKIWQLPAADGSNGNVLSTDGSGTLSWVAVSGGTVTSVTGTAPITVSSGTTTPSISISQAGTSANGYLSSTDWNTFNGKVGTARQVIAGTGLSGGGDLSADRTLSISTNQTFANAVLNNGGTGGSASSDVLVIQGAGSQTGNLQSWKNSSGTVLDVVSASGNLGIGTAGPVNMLDIYNSSYGANGHFFEVTNFGSVGIGTSAPWAQLELSGSYGGQINANGSPGQVFKISPATFTDSATTSATQPLVAISAFGQPTLNGYTGTSMTTTNASSVYIQGAPKQGTYETVVNTVGLNIDTKNVGSATNSYGLMVSAQTGATSNYAAVFSGGNVGIGTTAPGALLQVKGSADQIQAVFSANTTAQTNPVLRVVDHTGGDAFDVNDSGSVQVKAGTSSTPGFGFISSNNTGMFLPATTQLGFTTAGTERVRIDANGNVGIGQTIPAAKLDVAGIVQGSGLATSGPFIGHVAVPAGAYSATGSDHVILMASSTYQLTLPMCTSNSSMNNHVISARSKSGYLNAWFVAGDSIDAYANGGSSGALNTAVGASVNGVTLVCDQTSGWWITSRF